jgi:hypothetical protein
VTILQTLIGRGFFPKELPPALYTEDFAQFALSKEGRTVLSTYKPLDSFTECTVYSLARPGGDRRELRIPHPAAFFRLAGLTAKHMGRLLKKAGSSKFSKSRPVYSDGGYRSIIPFLNPVDLSKERACARSGASYLLKADISHFYPSLYTHAVGWAVDPKLRLKSNWKNYKLLGKRLDQCLMDADGKISQGIPIGNDISFLLAELVLSQIDIKLKVSAERACRWYDDYELAFDTRHEAETALKQINRELRKFHLRLNPKKTSILRLPQPAGDDWQRALLEAGKRGYGRPRQVVEYFDRAFALRNQYPESAVLSYALGMLFGTVCPSIGTGAVLQSCITQAVLCEPGAAQKGFALLTFWRLNGFVLDHQLLVRTINLMIVQHQHSGVSSDISWALAFALENGLQLARASARVLSNSDDDCVIIQALHLNSAGLLPVGFELKPIQKIVGAAEFDREHWLLCYEATRKGFISPPASMKKNPLFSALLKDNVSFYRDTLPPYAMVVHPGGAPDWLVQSWGTKVGSKITKQDVRQGSETVSRTAEIIAEDASRLIESSGEHWELIRSLLDTSNREARPSSGRETY